MTNINKVLEVIISRYSKSTYYYRVFMVLMIITLETVNAGTVFPVAVLTSKERQLSNALLIPLSEYIPCRSISVVTFFKNLRHAGSRSN